MEAGGRQTWRALQGGAWSLTSGSGEVDPRNGCRLAFGGVVTSGLAPSADSRRGRWRAFQGGPWYFRRRYSDLHDGEIPAASKTCLRYPYGLVAAVAPRASG